MVEDVQEARVWIYVRNIDGLSSSKPSSSSTGSSVAGILGDSFKHWGIVLEYYDEDGEIEDTILYEANDKEGLLIADDRNFTKKMFKKEWESKPGFKRVDNGVFDNLDQDRAANYCREFNKLEIRYVATVDNCQRFAEEFLANLKLDSKICLPVSVESTKSFFGSVGSLSSSSITKLGSGSAIKQLILNSVVDGGLNSTFKEAIKRINLNGFGKISILAESPLKEYMAEEGKQLILTSLGKGYKK